MIGINGMEVKCIESLSDLNGFKLVLLDVQMGQNVLILIVFCFCCLFLFVCCCCF